MISFRVDCIPPKTSHHAKKVTTRGGFPRMYDSPELKNAIGTLTALFMPYRPKEPMTGALELEVAYVFPYLGKHSQKARTNAEEGLIPCETKPDLDNLLKTLTDVLASLRFIENDSRITGIMASKWHGEKPGIFVEIRKAGGE